MEDHLKLSPTDLTLETLTTLTTTLTTDLSTTPPPPTITKLIHDICCFLTCPNPTLVLKSIQTLADAARTENTRMAIIAFEGMEVTVGHLRVGDEEMKLQCLRLIANLCFDSEEGRKRLMGVDGVKDVAEILLDEQCEDGLLRVAAGCISNVASVTPEICEMFVGYGVMTRLCGLLDHENPDVVYMVIRAISNLCETEEIRLWAFENLPLERLMKLAEQELDEDPDMSIEYVNCVGSIIDSQDLCFKFIDEMNGLDRLITLYSSTDDEDYLKKMVDLLCSLAENEDYRNKFKDLAPKIYNLIDSGDTLMKRYGASKITAYLSVSEEIAPFLFTHIDRFIELLQENDPEFPIYAGMTISNLAMDDEKVTEIFSRGVPMILMNLASSEESDIKLRHYCISALRNLSVLEANKAPILELGVMQPAIELLEQKMNAILVFNCLGLLKSLFALGQPSYEAFVENAGIENLLPLLDMDDTPHVFYESARTFCSLTNATEYHSEIMAHNPQKAILILIKGNFDLLKSEALDAIINLSSSEEHAQTLATEELIQEIIPCLSSEELSTKANSALILLSKTEQGKELINQHTTEETPLSNELKTLQ